MKKIVLSLLILVALIGVGCSKTDSEQSTENQKSIVQEENNYTDDTKVTMKRYDDVKKEYLKYEVKENTIYFCETNRGIESIQVVEESKRLNNKKYGQVLSSYMLPTVINASYMSYDEAIEMVKKVLPDDIKEEYIKENSETNHWNIFYSSTKGNFVVCFSYFSYTDNKGIEEVMKDKVIGIGYYKEV